MGNHKDEVIEKLDEILANQKLIMEELGIEKPKSARPPDDDDDGDAPD